MAQRKRTRRRSNKKKDEYPGWMWMLFGLAIGLSVAFAIYQKDSQPHAVAATQEPASLDTDMAQQTTAAALPPEVPADEEPASRFTFYDMLPKFEVVIPEEEPDVTQDSVVEAVQEPGLYVLQAGSFGELADADRRRAQLALHGIESRVQRVQIDDKSYHRVRIGPIDDLNQLNRIRDQLRQANIDVLRIRLGD